MIHAIVYLRDLDTSPLFVVRNRNGNQSQDLLLLDCSNCVPRFSSLEQMNKQFRLITFSREKCNKSLTKLHISIYISQKIGIYLFREWVLFT